MWKALTSCALDKATWLNLAAGNLAAQLLPPSFQQGLRHLGSAGRQSMFVQL